jgi:outer membrane protein assembly complex protein YaeT
MGFSKSYLLRYMTSSGPLESSGPDVSPSRNIKIRMLSESRDFSFIAHPRLPTRPPFEQRRQPVLANIRRLNSVPPCVLLLGLLSGCASQATKTPEPGDIDLDTVKKITYTGNEAFGAGTLLKAMSTQPRPFWRFWKRGDPYNPNSLEADLTRLRKYYFDRGYLDTSAKISNVQEDRESHTVTIEIAIDEGPPTIVGSIQIGGTIPPALRPKQQLLEALPLQPMIPLNKEDFDKSKSKLLLEMQNAGYARATVIPQTVVDEQTHSANITFTLRPGNVTSFGELTISGEKEVPEYVLRRELTVKEGDRYSVTALRDSEENLYSLPILRAVTTRAINLDAPNGPVNVDFEVIERKPHTGELSIGASSLESFRYQAKWTNRNLLGEAEQFSMLAQVSGIRQGLQAELFEPYVLSRYNSATHNVFAVNNQNIDTDPFGIMNSLFDIVDPYPAYNFVTFGGTSRLEHDFTKKLVGTLGLELTANKFYDVDESADPATIEGAEDNILFIQSAGSEWNDRNDDLNPTRGMLLRGNIEHSNNAVLSDVNFVKMLVEGRYYQPLGWRTVLATRLTLGGIEPYGDSKSIPGNVRFFAGGAGSVRGFANNRLGPLDADGNPIGGNSLLEGSVEWRFRITRDWGGVVFVDFGNVFAPALTYSLPDLRYTGGVGVRYFTPVGPLRLDVAFVLDRMEGDQTAPLYFSIGQAF